MLTLVYGNIYEAGVGHGRVWAKALEQDDWSSNPCFVLPVLYIY